MLQVYAALVLFVVSCTATIDCIDAYERDLNNNLLDVFGSCGYELVGQTVETAGEAFLRSSFVMPAYSSGSRSHTFLCARTQLDIAECYGSAYTPGGDKAAIRIPNVVNFEIPCHIETPAEDDWTSSWAMDAFEIPPVSNLRSYVDLVFKRDGVVSDNTERYWGAGISHLYITRVNYADSQWEEEAMHVEMYNKQWYQRVMPGEFPDYDWTDDYFPDPCDLNSQEFQVELVYDFWETCAHTWVEHPVDSLWNTQTEVSTCYCFSDDSGPWHCHEGVCWGYPNDEAQYFWWYGRCQNCHAINNGTGAGPDPSEMVNTFLPADNFDDDLDGVPDNCDLCPDFDDSLDADNDRVPDNCDLCPGFPDYVDINSNGVPDDCDLCLLQGCGPNADCEDVPVNMFECTCDLGFEITGPKYSATNFGAALVASATSLGNWLAADSDIVSSNFEEWTAELWMTAAEELELTIEFVLVHDIADYQIKNLFDDLLDYIDESVRGSCTDCGLFALSYSWEHLPGTDQNNDVVTAFTVKIWPYVTSWTYQGHDATAGCTRINECDLYGCGPNANCILSVPNARFCICDEGYSGDLHLEGATPFPGCTAPVNEVDMCAKYGCHTSDASLEPGLCTHDSGSQERTCTCDIGYEVLGQDGATSIVLLPDEVFSGCSMINYCEVVVPNKRAGQEGEDGEDSEVWGPCGEYSECTPMLDGYTCECWKGFFDVTGDGTQCTDPCEINNGGCQDLCFSPDDSLDGDDLECGCSSPYAQPSILDPRVCVCNDGYYGDGITCGNKTECVVRTAFGRDFFDSPKNLQNMDVEDPSEVCRGYDSMTCCDLTRPVFDPELTRDDIAGNGKCGELLETFFCSTCDPGQQFFEFIGQTLVVRICPAFCQQIFEACREAYPSSDDSDPPAWLTGDETDPIRFCESGSLRDLLPFATTTEEIDVFIDASSKEDCFAWASGLQPLFVSFLGLFGLWAFGVY